MIEKMIILLGLLAGLNAEAALSDLDKSVAAPRGNLLTNPGFEAGKAGWTASGGTFTTTNAAANKFAGAATGSWDSSSASQTITAASVAITSGNGLSGANITGGCYFKVASTYTGKVQLFDGTNVLAEASITNSTSGFTPTYVTGIAPTSGTVSFRLISVASNEPIVYPDDCYFGRADGFNLFQVSQASQYGTLNYAATLNCTWPNTNTSYTDFPLDSDCPTPTVTGNASAPATKIPGITFSTLPPGDYLVMVGITTSKSGGPTIIGYRWHDGTSSGGDQFTDSTASSVPATITGRFSYTTAQSNITFRLQGFRTGGTNVQIGNEDNPFQVKVYRFPTSSETAIRPDLAVNWGGISVAGSASDNPGSTGAWEAVSNATWATKTLLGSATAGTNANDLSFKIPYLPAGSYEITTNYQVRASNSANCHISVFDGTNRVGVATASNGVANGEDNINLSPAIITYTSAQTNKEFILQINGDSTSNCQVYGGLLSGSGPRQFFIKPVGLNIPALLLVNSVTSNSSGLTRLEHAMVSTLCSSTPCTIESQSGSWLSSISRSGTGQYTANIAVGIFSAKPTCWGIGDTGSAGLTMFQNRSSSTATSVPFNWLASSTATDAAFNLFCMGPR